VTPSRVVLDAGKVKPSVFLLIEVMKDICPIKMHSKILCFKEVTG